MPRREQIRRLHLEGKSGRAIADEIGVQPPTVSYHLRRLGFVPQKQRRHDWPAVQEYYDDGHTVRECLANFGMSSQTWHLARTRGDLLTRPAGMTIDELLSAKRNRKHIKGRLIREGLKAGDCERCGLRSWMGQPLSLDLHHMNGNRDDNRLENLQLLCPNCHRQTDTFGGRNRPGSGRAEQQD